MALKKQNDGMGKKSYESPMIAKWNQKVVSNDKASDAQLKWMLIIVWAQQ